MESAHRLGVVLGDTNKLAILLVTGIGVYRRGGWWTYVDHDGLLAHLPQSEGGADGTPIELDGTADTVNTASQDKGALVLKVTSWEEAL